MSMSDDQLDNQIDQQLKLAQRTIDMAEKSLIFQESNVKATLALAKAIEHLANTQEPQIITQAKTKPKFRKPTK